MTTKIPFDVEKWRSGKYDVVTRDDKRIIQIHFFNGLIENPIVAQTENERLLYSYDLQGRMLENMGDNSDDLFLTPKKRKVWIAVAPEIDGYLHRASYAYSSKEKLFECCADKIKDWHIIEVELPA